MVILRFGHDWDETCMQMDEVCRCAHIGGQQAAPAAPLLRGAGPTQPWPSSPPPPTLPPPAGPGVDSRADEELCGGLPD